MGPTSTHQFPPVPPEWQRIAAKAMGAIMWSWIFWRAKEDGPVLLVSFGPIYRFFI